MKQDKDRSSTDRRSFLKLAGLGTVGTVAAAASTVTASAAEDAPKSDSSYRETEHVRRAYELARF
jgi:hypothetical protein